MYLAREQARGNAFQTAMGGERREVPVEIYLEKVPETLSQRARNGGQRPPLSLTQLTNLHRLKVYEALKSQNVAYFVAQEAARRLHLDGRVITGPARFRVRVDPVPTPEQAEQIKHRLAQRHVHERLFLMSDIETSGNTPSGQHEKSLMSDIETSGGTPSVSQNAPSLMSDIETSGGVSERTNTVATLQKGAKSLMSAIETSRKNTPLMSDIETSLMFNIETSLMSEIETSGEGAFLSQNDNSLMSDIETSGDTPAVSQNDNSLMSDIETSLMFNIETSLMSEIETSGGSDFEIEPTGPRCLYTERHIDVSKNPIQNPKEKPKENPVSESHIFDVVSESRASAAKLETRVNAAGAETGEVYVSVRERAKSLAAKHGTGAGQSEPGFAARSSPASGAKPLPASAQSALPLTEPDEPRTAALPPPGSREEQAGSAATAGRTGARTGGKVSGSVPAQAARLSGSARRPPQSPSAEEAGTGAGGETGDGRDAGEAWRQETEDLARQSAMLLDDPRSLGFHIKVWHHARKADRQRGGPPLLTLGVFDILSDLERRRRETDRPQPQGKAWTRRTRKWFDDNGVPLLSKADEGELDAVRAVLAEELGR